MAFTGQRWIGCAIQVPCQMGAPSTGGRHTYYGATRLAGGEEVGLNDVVEVGRPGETSDEIPRLAQVLSMWEDAFTGERKFRARWLAHSSGLQEDISLRFRAARQRCKENDKSDQERTTPSGGRSSPSTDEDELFLTTKQEDLLLTIVVKPVTLGVPGTSLGKSGPRLNLAYDDDSRDFTPLERTHPIVARALARQAGAIAQASRGSACTTVSGWLLPRGGAAFGDKTSGGNADESVRDVDDSAGDIGLSSAPDTETEEDSSDGDSVGAEDPVSAEAEEWDRSGQEDDEDACEPDRRGGIDASSPSGTPKHAPVGVKGQEYTAPVETELSGGCRSSPRRSDKGMANGFPRAQAALAPPHGSSDAPGSNLTGSSFPPRSRRLAMPPAEADAASPVGANHSKLNPAARYSMRARQSIGMGARAPRALPSCGKRNLAPAQQSKRLLSGKRKRATKPAEEGSESEEEYPPRRTPVGDDFQVDIPDLLPVEKREEAAAAAAAAAEESGAKVIWRSIRDWDPHTRGMLAGYLQAAKAVVRTRQSRPDIAVHIRMGGEDAGKCATKGSGSADSFAAWALTATPGRGTTSACGIVRIACPANAQTEVPASAIQRVQYEEQALEALQSTSPMLDDFEPALHMLADSKMSPESLQPWTLDQVGTLEAALDKDLDPEEGLHGIDREDSIDLTKIINDIPGKSPGQVLFFYYRYLAAARPLIDVVYGPEAAKTRKREVFAGGDSDVEVPVTPRRGLARLTPPSTSLNGNRGTHDSVVDQNPAPLGLLTAAGRPHEGILGSNSKADGAGQLGHPGRAEMGAGLPLHGAEAGGGNDPDVGGSTPTPTPSVRGLGVPVAQSGQGSPSLWRSAPGPAAGLSSLGGPGDEIYGFMAPCWRLLDQAQPYVNQDQLVYLEGLIFRHLKSPLSRCQLLGRVKSCLEEQHDVYADFVSVFDRVGQHRTTPPRPSVTTTPNGPSSEAYIPLAAEPAYGSRFFPHVAAKGTGHVGPHQWPVPPYLAHDYGYGAMQGRGGSLFHPPPPPLLPTRAPQACHDDTYTEHEHKPRHHGDGPEGCALSGQEKPDGAPGPPGPAWESEGAAGPATKH